MKKVLFEKWLINQGISSYSNYISRIKSLEASAGDLDEHYNTDQCSSLLELFTYTKEDVEQQRLPKHNLLSTPNRGKDKFQSYFEGTNDYKSRISKYIDFRDALKTLPIYKELRAACNIDPDSHDGSYELIRKAVNIYATVPIDVLDSSDLDALWFLSVGTWKSGLETKKNLIDKGHLNPEQKEQIKSLLDDLWKKAEQGAYSNKEGGKPSIGMFGTGFHTFRTNVTDEAARSFLRMCFEISCMEDDHEIFERAAATLETGLKGIGSASASQFLHCLKPNTFPIINGKYGEGSIIYDCLGIYLIDSSDSTKYIENARRIYAFRDNHFSFKNFRVMDLAHVDIDNILQGDPQQDDVHENVEKVPPLLEASANVEMNSALQNYTSVHFLQEVFMSEKQYNTIVELLLRKKNVILQGVPGVGKTFAAKRLAYSLLQSMDEDKIKLVQFHQNYSYEDFIMGYKPDSNGFTLKNGVFYNFCKVAEAQPDKMFFFIIDEINRGNLSKIFGELLMLIESDMRGEKVNMAYTGQLFSVPHNLYIIGMMNTADRSLAIIDYALRRRFSFIELEPAFDHPSFEKHLIDNNVDKPLRDRIITKLSSLNHAIELDPSLGKGFRIGHSYFSGCRHADTNWYENIIKYEIAPALEEYWFDDLAKAQTSIAELLE